MLIRSPITSGKTKLLKKIPISYLIFLYSKGLGLSIENYFNGHDTICLYQCVDTGYKFYYPFNLNGLETFYKKLELNKWYYQKWKWEYEAANSFIKDGQKVLEVGCGRGYFLYQLKERGVDGIGLELNNEAIDYANKNGVNVQNKFIEEYANEESGNFDVVCAFQLLEHIWDVDSFFKCCIKLVKPNGLIIFAVPNNNAFFFKQKKILPKDNIRYINQLQTLALNMPPHHMGMWDRGSLKKLVKNYNNIELVSISEEPINKGRIELNNQLINNIYKNKFKRKFKKFICSKSLRKGDSLLVVYERK